MLSRPSSQPVRATARLRVRAAAERARHMLSSAAMNTHTPPTPERADFIRDIVAADLREGRHRVGRHALPSRAQRLPPHRPRQVDLPELRHRRGVRRPLPPALRRHEPGQGGAGVHRLHRDRRALARLRLGRAPLLRLGLLRAALRVGRATSSADGKAYVDDLTADEIREYRGTLTEPGTREPLARPPRRGEPRPVRAHARRRVPQRLARAARQDRHGLRQHQPARPGPVPDRPRRASPDRRRVVRLPDRTTSRTASPTRSRASRTPSARWSSRTTGRSTTGSSRTCRCPRARTSTSSLGSISPTPCCPSACSCASSTRATCADGTTRGCPPSPVCAAAASLPRESATSRR